MFSVFSGFKEKLFQNKNKTTVKYCDNVYNVIVYIVIWTNITTNNNKINNNKNKTPKHVFLFPALLT